MSMLLPGTQVEARALRWEVVHSEAAGEQQRYRLRCIDGGLRGFEFDFLYPFEEIRPVATELDPARAGRLRQWRLYHNAFLLEQALGPTVLLAAQPGRLDIAPYQLVPVMRALQMSRPRLLLADGVGLGKTIQAGLVMAELIARRRAHRILIISPAGPLLNQWHREMRERFGLRFDRIRNAGELLELRRSLVLGANPFDHVSYCMMSIDFAKQEKVLQDLERTSWDLIVIDEAHHCFKMGQSGDWEDSRRRRLSEVLARQADGLILLTATPHDGFDPHFASIVELLDPSLADGRGGLRGERYRRHVVRRLKHHIKDPKTGEDLFKIREVQPRPVAFGRETHPAFSNLQQALVEMVAPRLKRAVRRRRYGDVLAFVTLLKRSVSTVSACTNTINVIRNRYVEMVESGEEQAEARKQRLRTLNEYRRRLERFGALSFEEEQDQAALEAEDMAADLVDDGLEGLASRINELRLEHRRKRNRTRKIETTKDALDALVDLGETALEEDPKLDALVECLEVIRDAEPQANILVYSEYADSQQAACERVKGAIEKGYLTGEVLAISGDIPSSGKDDEDSRSRITDRFCSENDLILISTDASAEGLNLHERCHHLIHLELPYNPNRLEQRNGRIDRYGQKHVPKVQYLYLTGTFEERLLLRLVAKYEKQRARLTFVPNTLGGITTQDAQTVRLLEGLADEEASLFARPPREIMHIEDADDDVTTSAYQELLAEVERAMSGYEKTAKTNSWLADAGLNADTKLVEQASEAHHRGEQAGAVDLLAFVCEALETEVGGGAVSGPEDDVIELALPKTWIYGLRDIPGYDSQTNTLRLTASPQKTRDRQKRSVGYLGRAHPIVRRALDRVRSLRFGEKDLWIDRRVSAVTSDVAEPELLSTYLISIESDRGREFEQLVAVQVDRQGSTQVLEEPQDWLRLANLERQIGTKEIWSKHFEEWGVAARSRALAAARLASDRLAGPAQKTLTDRVEAEMADLDRWLAARTEAICGSIQIEQIELFTQSDGKTPRWRTLTDSVERLAAFATDGGNRPAERREADGVIRLYRQRKNDLEVSKEARRLEPVPLGLLMLLPAGTVAN
jgi:ERCC4-related helicase